MLQRVLEVAELAYTTKKNEFITSQKFGSHDFHQIANTVLNISKSVIPSHIYDPFLSSLSDKGNSFAEAFSKSSNLVDSGMCLPPFTSRTNLILGSIPLILRLFKKVITNLDSSEASGSD